MKKLPLVITACVAGLLAIGLGAARAQDVSIEVLVGETYNSEIWSGGALTPGSTTFHMGGDGTLGGSYILKELREDVSGSLADCEATPNAETRRPDLPGFVLHCQWSDRYGSGTLEMFFPEDVSGFTGYWGVGNETPTYGWSGIRVFELSEGASAL